MTELEISRMKTEFVNGNLDGLKRMYKLYRDDVINVVASKTKSANQNLEDYFNDSLIVLYEKILNGDITQMSSTKNYLIGICINKIRNEFSYKSRTRDRVEEIRTLLYSEENYDTGEGYRERLQEVCFHAMKKLSEKCQRIITSYYLDGLSMKEIATHLDLSSSDVSKTLKNRCYKSLLSHIQISL